MNLNRVKAGSLAVRVGRSFEESFEAVCRYSGVAVSRIPDGCKVVGRGQLKRVKSPFDWILSYHGQVVIIDTKTVNESVFAHSAIDLDQARAMLEHQNQGTLAGYVVYLRKSNQVIFVDAWELCRRIPQGPGSVKPGDPRVFLIGQIQDFNPRLIFSVERAGNA